MTNFLSLFAPLRELYVPGGWLISINHLFDINPEGFSALSNEHDQLHARDLFVSETIFYGKHEYPVTTTQFLSGIVYAGCKFIDYERFELQYDITLIVVLERKKHKDQLLMKREIVHSCHATASMLSNFMKAFSHEEIVELKAGRLKAL